MPGKSHGWKSLVGCSPWGREEWDTTERLHFHFLLSCIGEGNGNPLQCSCLENHRDWGDWWVSIYGVAQSQTETNTEPMLIMIRALWSASHVGSKALCFSIIQYGGPSYEVICLELWRRQWHPTPVLLPGKSHGWRSLVGCSPWGRWESDTTERLHFHFLLSCIGGGNGNPLQCSCLENPRDGGA